MQNLSGQLQICHQPVLKMGFMAFNLVFILRLKGFIKKKPRIELLHLHHVMISISMYLLGQNTLLGAKKGLKSP
jgi:hypothetical protein